MEQISSINCMIKEKISISSCEVRLLNVTSCEAFQRLEHSVDLWARPDLFVKKFSLFICLFIYWPSMFPISCYLEICRKCPTVHWGLMGFWVHGNQKQISNYFLSFFTSAALLIFHSNHFLSIVSFFSLPTSLPTVLFLHCPLSLCSQDSLWTS